MIAGYFTIGGGSPIELPTFESSLHKGNLVGSRDKGHWCLETDWDTAQLDIPSRDKSVHLWADKNLSGLEQKLAHIDSDQTGMSYLQKLQSSFPNSEFSAFILNVNKDTHGSLALMANTPIFVHGLHDTQLKCSYLVWSDSLDRLNSIRSRDPLRFLLYRFPDLNNQIIFIQAEAVCSKWWRWMKSHQSQLHAFNALEYKLYGHP